MKRSKKDQCQMDPCCTSAYWYLLRNHHQLSWAPLIDVAIAVNVDTEANRSHHTCSPHEYHSLPHVRPLVSALNKHDGKYWDIRINFYGMDDSIRLQRNISKSTKSPPALTWKERIYRHLIDVGCHNDEVGIDLEELLAVPDLQRPLSLQVAKEQELTPATIPTGQGGEVCVIPPRQCRGNWQLSELLRKILEDDPRFDVRYNNQLEKVSKKAAVELHARDCEREEVMMKPGNTLERHRFATIWAVFLRELPQYYIRYYGVSSIYSQAQVATVDKGGSEDSDTDNEDGLGMVEEVVIPASVPLAKNLGKGQDLQDDPGMTGCGVTLHRRRVKHVTDNYSQSREDEIWRWGTFVGNSALRVVGEYTALTKALKYCNDKGYYPILIQTISKDIPRAFRAEIPTFKAQSIKVRYQTFMEQVHGLQAQASKTQFLSPEYYNILGLPCIENKKKGSSKLLQVTGKPSTFTKWSDEIHTNSTIGQYCHVESADVVRFEVMKPVPNSINGAPSHPLLEVAIHLARSVQEEGFVLARGWAGKIYTPEISADIASKYDSNKEVKQGMGLEGQIEIELDALMPPNLNGKSIYRGVLPGLNTAEATVSSSAFIGAWDKAVVGKQEFEAPLAMRTAGQWHDDLVHTVLEEQPGIPSSLLG